MECGMQKTDRYIYLIGKVDKNNTEETISALLRLDEIDSNTPITLFINSIGGSVVDGMAIVQTMGMVRCGVKTICIGAAGGIAAVVLASGMTGGRGIVRNGAIDLDLGINSKVGGLVGKKVVEATSAVKIIIDAKLCMGRYKNSADYCEILHSGRLIDAYNAVNFGLVDFVIKEETCK